MIPLYLPRAAHRELGVFDRPGCYLARARDGEPLYVGKSKALLTRVHAHFIDQRDGFGRRWRLSGLVEWYCRCPFAEQGALLEVFYAPNYHDLEADLFQQFNPSFNRKNICLSSNSTAEFWTPLSGRTDPREKSLSLPF